MIQLRSILKPASNVGAKKLRVVRMLGSASQRAGRVGDVVVASVLEASPGGEVKKNEKVRALVIRTKKEYRRDDGSYIRFDDNAAVIIDKNGLPLGTRIFGPVAREIKQKGYDKIAAMAEEVL
jgi:large subunit ribosomal protein L14